jgi:hypothetical protein
MALDSSFLVGGPPTPLLSPLDKQARQIAIQNALAAGALQQQALEGGELDLQQKRQAIAQDQAFRALFQAPSPAQQPPATAPGGTPVAGGAGTGPAAPGNLAPGSAVPGVPTIAAGAQGTPVNALSVAPPAAPAVPPTAAPMAPAGAPPPAGAPAAAAGDANPYHQVSDAQIYQIFGSKGQGLIDARNNTRKVLADTQKTQDESNKLNNDYWGHLADGLEQAKYDPRAVQGVLSQAAADGKQGTPQFQALLNAAKTNPAAIPALASQAIAQSDEVQKQRSERLTAESRAVTATATAGKENAATDAATRINVLQRLADANNQDQYRAMVNGLTPAEVKLANPPDPNTWTVATKNALKNQQLTGEQSATLTEQQIRDRQTALHEAQTVGIERGRLGLEATRVGLEQRKAAGALGSLTPADQSIAQKVATGDFNPAQLGRMPNKEAIMAGAININPNWTPQAYNTKQAFFDPDKKQSQNLGTISRIVGHIGRYETNSQALGFAPAYGLGYTVTGAQKTTSEDAHAIAGELEKLVSGGVGSQAEIDAWKKDLRSSFADTRQNAVDEISKLVGSQYEGMNQTYKAGVGMDLPVDKLVTPEGIAWMKAKGIKGVPDVAAAAPGTPAPTAAPAPHGVPELGSTFNGQKVLRVTRIQ